MSSKERHVIEAFVKRYQEQKRTAERAVAQVSDAQLRQALDENTNSLAVIMKHVGGNLRSRFTDFLTSDGEKPDRDRDGEFVDDLADRAALMAFWDAGWKCLFDSLAGLDDGMLGREVKIRQEPVSVADALVRSLAHSGYHVGQIVQLARFLAKDRWETLTIPRGASRQFDEKMRQKFGK